MALGAVLVDRARLIEDQETAYKVEGATQFAVVTGSWFRARLTMPAAARRGAPGTVPGVEQRPSLLYKLKDDTGVEIALSVNSRVEVDSAQLGRAVYEVDGNPEPLRKRRTIIGHLAQLRRVEDFRWQDLPDVREPVGKTLGLPYRVYM